MQWVEQHISANDGWIMKFQLIKTFDSEYIDQEFAPGPEIKLILIAELQQSGKRTCILKIRVTDPSNV